MSQTIAIVGRPNVGKSALFNRLAGRRIAIVHDQPGVTRDRISAEVEWRGRPYTLIDTGGIGLRPGEKTHDVLVEATRQQVELAVASAAVLLFVVDIREGLVPLDEELADWLRASGKPVLIVANKADTPDWDTRAVEFAALGFDRIFPVSAEHGRGVEPLMRTAMQLLPPEPKPADPTAGPSEPPLKLAIVGRPNVGKSSLINALIGSARVIVSPIPGTTRDAVDVPFELDVEGHKERYILIDTAGLRKRTRIHDSIEFYSVTRTEASVRRADVVLFVLDAEAGIVELDKKIGGMILEAGKPCVLLVNKWDLFQDIVQKEWSKRHAAAQSRGRPEPPPNPLQIFSAWVREKLFFLDYAPVIFTSAVTGFQLDRVLEAVRYVAAQMRQTIPTSLLNRTLHDAVERRQPVTKEGHRLKFFYATQTSHTPPTFLLFVNREEDLSEPYKKYLIGELRKAFGFEGCPIVLIPRARPKTVPSIRSHDHAHKLHSRKHPPTSRRKDNPH
ncbi:MAG: ribosome biogenesis GTPase Der [Verrucomicrobiota bacterium]|nr:ribosome biogenesis GTPase Der [Limisphaera sp.]MDW8382576.1 ribosome biogenesis GTPase Der [Verrucomicrobiota bacterium]